MGAMTKEALHQYKEKLEQGILEYMRMPPGSAPPAASGGCWNAGLWWMLRSSPCAMGLPLR